MLALDIQASVLRPCLFEFGGEFIDPRQALGQQRIQSAASVFFAAQLLAHAGERGGELGILFLELDCDGFVFPGHWGLETGWILLTSYHIHSFALVFVVVTRTGGD